MLPPPPSRLRLLLIALLACCAPACEDGGGGHGGGMAIATTNASPPAVPASDPVCEGRAGNRPFDADGDGALDTVCVDDFDGDDALEMDDLQDAVEALDDGDRRLVVVLAGVYAPPVDPRARPGRTHALIELPDHAELRCLSGAVLNGPQGTSAAHDFAVVSNADHVIGNVAVAIVGCEIDGGAPDVYFGRGFSTHLRIGVFFRRTRDSRVEDSFVHHTYHTGLYTSLSRGDVFRNNLVEDAGGFGNTDTIARTSKPCIYAYATAGEPVEDFTAAENHLVRCAASGLNTRVNHSNAAREAIRNLVWTDNVIEHTGYAVAAPGLPPAWNSQCMHLRSVEGALVADNLCRSAGAVRIGPGDGFRGEGDESASSGIVIERLRVEDADATAGIEIGRYVDGLVIRDVEVDGTRADDGSALALPCVRLETPLRDARFERVTLRDCGAEGLYEATTAGSGATQAESLVLRDLTIENSDLADPTGGAVRAGLRLRGAHRGLLIERLVARAATGPEVWFEGPLIDATLEDVVVDGLDPGWDGAFFEASAPLCDATRNQRWITSRDGSAPDDCDFTPGTTGGSVARCACRSGTWQAKPTNADRPGIEFLQGELSSNVDLRDVRVSNARGQPGVRVQGEVSGWSITRLTGTHDSPATDLPQRSALELPSRTTDAALVDVVCIGTDPSAVCIGYGEDGP